MYNEVSQLVNGMGARQLGEGLLKVSSIVQLHRKVGTILLLCVFSFLICVYGVRVIILAKGSKGVERLVFLKGSPNILFTSIAPPPSYFTDLKME